MPEEQMFEYDLKFNEKFEKEVKKILDNNNPD